ncbi:MAG: hypothetical protein WBN31_07640 [Gammaproteobacteria bacterium]
MRRFGRSQATLLPAMQAQESKQAIKQSGDRHRGRTRVGYRRPPVADLYAEDAE